MFDYAKVDYANGKYNTIKTYIMTTMGAGLMCVFRGTFIQNTQTDIGQKNASYLKFLGNGEAHELGHFQKGTLFQGGGSTIGNMGESPNVEMEFYT